MEKEIPAPDVSDPNPKNLDPKSSAIKSFTISFPDAVFVLILVHKKNIEKKYMSSIIKFDLSTYF